MPLTPEQYDLLINDLAHGKEGAPESVRARFAGLSTVFEEALGGSNDLTISFITRLYSVTTRIDSPIIAEIAPLISEFNRKIEEAITKNPSDSESVLTLIVGFIQNCVSLSPFKEAHDEVFERYLLNFLLLRYCNNVCPLLVPVNFSDLLEEVKAAVRKEWIAVTPEEAYDLEGNILRRLAQLGAEEKQQGVQQPVMPLPKEECCAPASVRPPPPSQAPSAACSDGFGCRDWSDQHRDAFTHPCKRGRDCGFFRMRFMHLKEYEDHNARYTHDAAALVPARPVGGAPVAYPPQSAAFSGAIVPPQPPATRPTRSAAEVKEEWLATIRKKLENPKKKGAACFPQEGITLSDLKDAINTLAQQAGFTKVNVFPTEEIPEYARHPETVNKWFTTPQVWIVHVGGAFYPYNAFLKAVFSCMSEKGGIVLISCPPNVNHYELLIGSYGTYRGDKQAVLRPAALFGEVASRPAGSQWDAPPQLPIRPQIYQHASEVLTEFDRLCSQLEQLSSPAVVAELTKHYPGLNIVDGKKQDDLQGIPPEKLAELMEGLSFLCRWPGVPLNNICSRLSNYRPQSPLAQAALAAVGEFLTLGYDGFILAQQEMGTGKTHLAIGLCKRLMSEEDCDVHFIFCRQSDKVDEALSLRLETLPRNQVWVLNAFNNPYGENGDLFRKLVEHVDQNGGRLIVTTNKPPFELIVQASTLLKPEVQRKWREKACKLLGLRQPVAVSKPTRAEILRKGVRLFLETTAAAPPPAPSP